MLASRGIGHFFHNKHLHLLLEIERTAELAPARLHSRQCDDENKRGPERPTDSVALVMTQEQSSRKIMLRSIGAMSIGDALSERNCVVFPVRSTQ